MRYRWAGPVALLLLLFVAPWHQGGADVVPVFVGGRGSNTPHPTVVAEFSTPVVNQSPGRLHNLTLAARLLNGKTLEPQQVWSFNEVVGPRTPERGWQEAQEIYNGEFVTGVGGGICQVSSTLYNAALLAGLEVAERAHHSRPLSYLPPGRDATVAWPNLDLKVRNPGPEPLTIAAEVTPAGQLAVRLLGPRHRRQVIWLESTGHQILPPEFDEWLDPALLPGQQLVESEGLAGHRVKVYRAWLQGGQVKRELISADWYPPRPARVLRGPAS